MSYILTEKGKGDDEDVLYIRRTFKSLNTARRSRNEAIRLRVMKPLFSRPTKTKAEHERLERKRLQIWASVDEDGAIYVRA